MKIYNIDSHYQIVCEWKKTRTAFKHVATLLKDGNEVDSTKICYLNRTWERFDFESVIRKLLEKTKIVSDEDIRTFLDKIAEGGNPEFRVVAMVAKLGDVFGKTQAEKNDWKARMLKAGLENSGLIMPDDWNTLSESDKESRLNGAIAELI